MDWPSIPRGQTNRKSENITFRHTTHVVSNETIASFAAGKRGWLKSISYASWGAYEINISVFIHPPGRTKRGANENVSPAVCWNNAHIVCNGGFSSSCILQDIFGEKYSDESGGITFEEFVRAMVARSEQNKRFHSDLSLRKMLKEALHKRVFHDKINFTF